MNSLSILQLIFALAPQGITAVQDLIKLIEGLTGAINGTPGTPEHTAAVQTLSAIKPVPAA